MSEEEQPKEEAKEEVGQTEAGTSTGTEPELPPEEKKEEESTETESTDEKKDEKQEEETPAPAPVPETSNPIAHNFPEIEEKIMDLILEAKLAYPDAAKILQEVTRQLRIAHMNATATPNE